MLNHPSFPKTFKVS